MQLLNRTAALAAALFTAGLLTAGCSVSAGDVTNLADAAGADELAASVMQETVQGWGYSDVTVVSAMNDGQIEGAPAPGTVRVFSATAGHPQLSCKINIEQELGTAKPPYFDAVIANGMEFEVVDAKARSLTKSTDTLAYVAKNHAGCVIPTAATP